MPEIFGFLLLDLQARGSVALARAVNSLITRLNVSIPDKPFDFPVQHVITTHQRRYQPIHTVVAQCLACGKPANLGVKNDVERVRKSGCSAITGHSHSVGRTNFPPCVVVIFTGNWLLLNFRLLIANQAFAILHSSELLRWGGCATIVCLSG